MGVRRYDARFVASGVATAMAKSCPLEDAETLREEWRIRVRTGLRRALGYLRVTDRRVCVLTHRILSADSVLEIPIEAIRRVDPPNRRSEVRIWFGEGTSESVAVMPIRLDADGRPRAVPDRAAAQVLIEVLRHPTARAASA